MSKPGMEIQTELHGVMVVDLQIQEVGFIGLHLLDYQP